MPAAAPTLAPPCRCERPRLIGDELTCTSCGRDVIVSPERLGLVDGWIELAAAIERGRRTLRARARDHGIDPDLDRARYRQWLLDTMPRGG